MKRHIHLLLFLVFVFQCSDTTEPSGETTVSGVLEYRNQPIADVRVQIDDVLNWSTMTDADGYFEINNVTKGRHTLKSYKVLNNEMTISSSSAIVVSGSTTEIGTIRLPEPSVLYDIDTLSVSDNAIPLVWSRSSDPEFREYKIYRKEDAGIDETTGQLIYVSTNPEDTSFVDSSFTAGFRYFYRVYILSAFGKLGGSNVVNANTPVPSLLPNGNFEQTPAGPNQIPDWNAAYGLYELDSLTVSKGRYSLRATRELDNPAIDFWIDQRLSAAVFSKNQVYKFSLKMKSTDNTTIGAVIYYTNPYYEEITPEFIISGQSDWQTKSTTFTVPDDANTVTVNLRLYTSQNATEDGVGWFDDVRIEVVP